MVSGPRAAGIYEFSVHARYRYQSAYRPQGIHPHPRTRGRKHGLHSRDGQLSNPVSYGSFLKLNILSIKWAYVYLPLGVVVKNTQTLQMPSRLLGTDLVGGWC